jgi:hypothetical protein
MINVHLVGRRIGNADERQMLEAIQSSTKYKLGRSRSRSMDTAGEIGITMWVGACVEKEESTRTEKASWTKKE